MINCRFSSLERATAVVAEAKKGERKGEGRGEKNRECPGDAIIRIICKALFLELYYMNQPPLPTNT
jgi:hypothetical protein